MALYCTNQDQPSIRRLICAILLFGSPLFGQSVIPVAAIEEKVVSLHQLQHQVPRAARLEMAKGCADMLKHRGDQAIQHFTKAVRIDPEYVEARNNLAVSLSREDPEAAIGQLKTAIDIDPHMATLYENLAATYLSLNRLEDAERAARSSVDLDRTNTRMRTVLGIALALEHKYTAEALADLEPGSQQYPEAGLLAARILIEHNQLGKARLYVNEYLSSGDQVFRQAAENWLHYIDRNLSKSAAVPIPSVTAPQ
jgi:tetratricopeptide (TPR) repeat protein